MPQSRISWAFVFLFCTSVFARTDRVYNLKIHNFSVNFTGVKVDHALAINGSIPAPTLRFKKGEMAVINVTNELNEPTTLHWHGVLVPWNMDGPEFSNTQLIKPKETFTFRFLIRHTGTYWYHSHTDLQEQSGLYGAIVIEDENPHRNHADHDLVAVLSDWSNEKPTTILRNLKMDGDYYAFKKKSFPSWIGAIRHGSVWDYLKSEWIRMGAMDLSDVGYDAFLVNGKKNISFSKALPGQKVRLRLIDAGSSTYFYVNFGQLRNFTVISKDGVDVVPVKVNELLMGPGETYDIILEMPKDPKISVELRATAQDVTGYSSITFGAGKESERVPDKLRPNPYVMDHGGHDGGHGGGHGGGEPGDGDGEPGDGDGEPGGGESDGGGHGGGHGGGGHTPASGSSPMPIPMSAAIPMTNRLNYKMLKSPVDTSFDASLPRRNIDLDLDGDMNRFIWTINGKSFSEEKYIMIRYDEIVRFTMRNKTMMHHPMHLHGHFFRILNGQDKYSPNIHTVDVAPMQTVIIEFRANEPGVWFLHCHNLYHMMMGMARLVKYEGFKIPGELEHEEKAHGPHMIKDSDFYPSAEVKLYSNRSELRAKLNGGRWDLELNLEIDEYKLDTLNADVLFKRYLNRFTAVVGGAEYEDKKLSALIGLAHTLPLNVEVLSYVRTDGKVIIKLRKSIPIIDRVTLDIEPEFSYKEKIEFELGVGLGYQFTAQTKVGLFFRQTDTSGSTIGLGVSVRF